MKSYEPKVLMLDETLGVGEEVVGDFSRMFLGWSFQALDALEGQGVWRWE